MIPVQATYQAEPGPEFKPQKVTIVNTLIDALGRPIIFFIRKDGTLDVESVPGAFTSCRVGSLGVGL